MPQPRKAQISLSNTLYYHCISRCVRRAYLCGEDPVTGKSFAHRQQWIEDQLLLLPKIFAISVSAFSVMSNHCHIVLKVQPQKAAGWDVKEVLTRWHKLFKGTLLTAKLLKGEQLNQTERETASNTAEAYRKRLASISWFMRVVNEKVARAANSEDQCTGRFWEGRFKCQALLDRDAVVSCMAYVDLNPIRAGAATDLESSFHTSIRLRIKCALNKSQPNSILPFSTAETADSDEVLPFALSDYLQLVDETSRCIISNKGHMAANAVGILERLNIATNNWLVLSQKLLAMFCGPIGRPAELSRFAKSQCRKRRTGIAASQMLFG